MGVALDAMPLLRTWAAALMPLFKNQLHQEIWIEHHCGFCYHGKGLSDPTQTQCQILAKALAHDRKPVQWERNPRKGVLMADTMKCHAETRTPPLLARPVVNVDLPMFDVISTERMDTDHA